MWDFLKSIAPTVASAVAGPAGGAFVQAIGAIIGDENPTVKTITQAMESQRLTPEQIVKIKELELKAQQDEREGAFRYADLAFRDRDSARRANVAGGTQNKLFALSLLLLTVALGSEVYVLFKGYPAEVPEIVVGRILGLLDSVATLVLAYWFGTTNGSMVKTEALANSTPSK